MVEEGYHLEHLGLSAVIKKLEDTLQSYTRSIETAEINGIEDGLKEIKEQIEVMYDLLEGEVTAKKYVLSNQSQITESLANITTKNEFLKNEVEQVKETYHMSEAELEILNELEEKTATMKKMAEFLLTNENLSSAAYSVLRDKVEEIFANIKEVEDKQQSLLEILQALRKDEIEAREKIKNLRKLFQDTARFLERSNLPGVPQDIETKLLDAQEVIQDCFNSLDEKPLRMQFVQTSLQKAESIVNDIHNQVVEMVENVYFIEKIIQYGNRYRRKYPAVHKRLTVAEESFRRYDYNSAFEEAAAAVEEAEPGALRKIEELINEEYEQDVR
jgi:septation ring formation regulator